MYKIGIKRRKIWKEIGRKVKKKLRKKESKFDKCTGSNNRTRYFFPKNNKRTVSNKHAQSQGVFCSKNNKHSLSVY